MGETIRGLERRLTLRVRMNQKEQLAFHDAADLAGIKLSSWARMILREAAMSRLHGAGRKADL